MFSRENPQCLVEFPYNSPSFSVFACSTGDLVIFREEDFPEVRLHSTQSSHLLAGLSLWGIKMLWAPH